MFEVLKEPVLIQARAPKSERKLSAIRKLKLSLTRFNVTCLSKGALGLHFVKCFIFKTHEDVVTDHVLVTGAEVRVLDKRE